MTEDSLSTDDSSRSRALDSQSSKFSWMPGDITIIKKGNSSSESTESSEDETEEFDNTQSQMEASNTSKLRFVFIDACIYYVDERGEHEGRLSDIGDAEEERSRLRTICNCREWLRAAITLGDQLIELARRSTDGDTWGCTSGYYGGGNPGPNQMMSVIKSLTGRRPTKPIVGTATSPSIGRWSVWRVFSYERGQQFPSVGIWHLGFTQNPQFFPRWCNAIASKDETTVAILPDSPIMRELARRWNEGELSPQRQRWRGDQVTDYVGSAIYCKTWVSGAVEIDGTEIDGNRFAGAVAFLQARHQLRISPLDVLRDQLLSIQIDPFEQEKSEAPQWTPSNVARLSAARKRFDRPQRLHAWREEASRIAPAEVFDSQIFGAPNLRACLFVAERATVTGHLGSVLLNPLTGWSDATVSREQVPGVPAASGIGGKLIDWYRQVFELAYKFGFVDKDWFSTREKWHEEAYRTYPQEIREYVHCIGAVEDALALGVPVTKENLPVWNDLFSQCESDTGALTLWFQKVFTFAERLGISSTVKHFAADHD